MVIFYGFPRFTVQELFAPKVGENESENRYMQDSPNLLIIVVMRIRSFTKLLMLTRIPSGIESRLLTHGPKFDRES